MPYTVALTYVICSVDTAPSLTGYVSQDSELDVTTHIVVFV